MSGGCCHNSRIAAAKFCGRKVHVCSFKDERHFFSNNLEFTVQVGQLVFWAQSSTWGKTRRKKPFAFKAANLLQCLQLERFNDDCKGAFCSNSFSSSSSRNVAAIASHSLVVNLILNAQLATKVIWGRIETYFTKASEKVRLWQTSDYEAWNKVFVAVCDT